MKKNKNYFLNIAAKKLFAEINCRKGGGLHGELITVPFPALVYTDDERELDDETKTIGPFYYAVPRTARRLRKEVAYIRGHY